MMTLFLIMGLRLILLMLNGDTLNKYKAIWKMV